MTRVIADKLFINGLTLAGDGRVSPKSQLAIKGRKILAVGTDLSAYKDKQTEIIDLQGAVVAPGFIDAHLHCLWGGESLLAIPLKRATSKNSFIGLVSKYAEGKQQGTWLKGGGWNEHLFIEGKLPHKSWLDQAAPGHPMILFRHDGHSGIASSTALAMAGINRETPEPEGGVIDRDREGEPTGILRDAAMSLVTTLIPKETEAELIEYLDAAQQYLLSHGVTAVGDMIYDMGYFRFLQKMAHQGKLRIRFSIYGPLSKWEELKQLLNEGIYEDEWFQFKGLKAFSDGSLGSHTALMLEPYEDTPESSGLYDTDWEDIIRVKQYISEADHQNYQTVVHAIGDKAVREVLDVFQSIIKENGSRDRRFRIEHAQHVHPRDQHRFSDLDVIASVQPAHCVDDSLYAEKLLGERSQYAYPFRTLKKNGTRLAFGSDWPVSPADPVATIHGAIHRAGWHLEEAVDLKTAIISHTSEAAFAGFRDHDLGRLKPGYLADFVILDPKFLELTSLDSPPAGLIQAVFVDGKDVYQNKSSRENPTDQDQLFDE